MHPKVASRDCDHCKAWRYDEETGEVETHAGEPQRRNNPDKTPCRTSKGCPKGTPEDSLSLTPENDLLWRFIRECRATQDWPDCATIREAAAVVEMAERFAFQAIEERRVHNLFKAVLAARGV